MSFFRRVTDLSRNPMVGLVLVTGLTLGASGINFISQALLAFRFGAGTDVDSYAFSLSVPIFVAGLVASIISYTVVPMIAVEHDNPERRSGICFAFAWIGVGIGLLLALLSIPGLLIQPYALPSGSPIMANTELPAMILAGWFAAGAQVMGAMMTAQLIACRRPIAAALLGLLPGLSTSIALLALARLGIVVAVAGLFVGSLLAAAVGLYLQRMILLAHPARIDFRAEAGALMHNAIWAALALSCFSSFAVSDAYWAARMPEGSLASLSFVQRLIIGIGSLVVAGPSALFVPRFAAFVSVSDGRGFGRLLARTLMVVWGLGAASAALLYVCSEQMVALLFKRGSFGDDDVLSLSALFRDMAPGFVAMIGVVILMRALFCIKGTGRLAAILGGGWCLLYFGLSGLLHHRGALGIAESYSTSWIIMAIAMTALTFYRIGQIDRDGQHDA